MDKKGVAHNYEPTEDYHSDPLAYMEHCSVFQLIV